MKDRGVDNDTMKSSYAGMVITNELTRAYIGDEFGVANLPIGGKDNIRRVMNIVETGCTADRIICPNGSSYDHTTDFYFGEAFIFTILAMMNDGNFSGFRNLSDKPEGFDYYENKYAYAGKRKSALLTLIQEDLLLIYGYYKYDDILSRFIKLADMFGVDAYESTILRLTYNELQGYTNR